MADETLGEFRYPQIKHCQSTSALSRLRFGVAEVGGRSPNPRGFLRCAQSSPGHPTLILSSDKALVPRQVALKRGRSRETSGPELSRVRLHVVGTGSPGERGIADRFFPLTFLSLRRLRLLDIGLQRRLCVNS